MSNCSTASATARRKSPSPAFSSNSASTNLSSVIGSSRVLQVEVLQLHLSRPAPMATSTTPQPYTADRPENSTTSVDANLAKPRVVLIMLQAGKPVDDVIDELLPYLEPGDIVIDGGNSLFTDTDRRFTSLKEKKVRFIGMGVSGGEEGALEGPSMMPGGEKDAYARVEPILSAGQ